MTSIKELPHDLLAEKSLLGCLLIDGKAFDEIIDLSLKKEDFFHPQYGTVFGAIKELAYSSQPIDFVMVCSKLTDMGKLEVLGSEGERGQAFILNIVEDQASAANIYHYAKTVKEKSTIRNIIKVANKIAEKGTSYAGDTKEFISEVESSFFKITSEIRSGGMKKLINCLRENLKELEDPSLGPGELRGLTTGFKNLDVKLLGLQAGQLIIVAARPGMGKTSLGLNLAVNIAKNPGLPVAVFSLEMLAHELSMRILSYEAKIESKRLRTKDFLDTDLRNMASAVQRISTLPIFINDSGSLTIFDIQSECRKIKAENGLGLILVDYVQLMKSHSNIPSREQQISEISRGLKQLAKEMECPVVALSQLNRGVESRTEKRPMVSDLRESGSLEQDADIVILIYRDDFYNPDTKEKNVAEIIIGKNRSGETGTVKLAWLGTYTSFGNLANEGGSSGSGHSFS